MIINNCGGKGIENIEMVNDFVLRHAIDVEADM
jgi:hypothetical protein